MKTKTIVLSAALLVAVSVGLWRIAAVLSAPEPPAADATSVVVHPAAPVVVAPASNFDLEVCSPAHLDEMERNVGPIEAPLPDLTWYDPNGLEDIAGTS